MQSQFCTHPFVDLLPRRADEELQALAHDIAAHGQREPATVWTNTDHLTWLLDGQHRAQAVERLRSNPRTTSFDGTGEKARALAMSLNAHRRI